MSRIEHIKNNVNIVDVVERYTDLKKSGNSFLAVENPIREEKTSSFYIYEDSQRFYDFGNDENQGDVIDFIGLVENLDKGKAIKFIEDHYIGDAEYTPEPIKRTVANVPELTKERRSEVIAEIWRFDKNSVPIREIEAVAPSWLNDQATDASIDIISDLTCYDAKNRTLVIKIHDYDGNIISYKRRRFKDGKWVTAYATHPNKQCLVNIKDDSAPIYIVEGHHDFLTAILLGINVMAIPTVSYRTFNDRDLSYLSGRDIVLIPDIDGSDSVESMVALADQIEDALSLKILKISEILRLMDIEVPDAKIDLSEVTELWDRSREDFINTLLYVADLGEMMPKGEIF